MPKEAISDAVVIWSARPCTQRYSMTLSMSTEINIWLHWFKKRTCFRRHLYLYTNRLQRSL